MSDRSVPIDRRDITNAMRKNWAANYRFFRDLRRQHRLTVDEFVDRYGRYMDDVIVKNSVVVGRLKPMPPLEGIDE